MKRLVKRAMMLLLVLAMTLGSVMPASAGTITASVIETKKSVGGYSIPASMTIQVGEQKTLKVTEPAGKYANVSFQYHPSYVSTSGFSAGAYWKKSAQITFKGLKPGTFTSYVTMDVHRRPGVPTSSYIKYTLECKITVVKKGTSATNNTAAKKVALKSISLNKSSATLEAGKTLSLNVSYNPSNTTDSKTASWSSSNTAVATVSGGKITAKKAGTATITAKVGSKKATCKVTVKAAAKQTTTNGKYVNVNACYTKLNSYRASAGRKALTKNATLESYAKIRAKELQKKYSHTRPNGTKGTDMIPWSMCGAVNGTKTKGENIAMGQKSCAEVMTAWYNSPGHKANMLNSNFTKVGIAAYQYNGVIYWVQLFAS